MFPLHRILKCATPVSSVIRSTLRNKSSLVDLAIDNEGIAFITMQRPPVNSLNLELLEDFSGLLDEVAQMKVKGAILTSAMPSIFSAGLDIMEVYKPDLQRAELFWTTMQDVWLKLFGSRFVSAAAINGHAPAGGCLLSLSCEYRAMVGGNYSIGLNETALGIVPPPWTQASMLHTIPKNVAEKALTSGKLFTVEEAYKVGLIDAVAVDKSDAIEKCKQFIRKFDKIPQQARSLTKQRLREAPVKILLETRRDDTNAFLNNIKNPEVQRSIEIYIEILKQKKKSRSDTDKFAPQTNEQK